MRSKNIITVKDFQEDCEWKWLVNKQSERLRAKENGNGHKTHKKQVKIIFKLIINMEMNAMKSKNRV